MMIARQRKWIFPSNYSHSREHKKWWILNSIRPPITDGSRMRSTLVRHVLLAIISWMWLEFRLKISSSGSSSSRQAKKPSNPTCLIYRNFSLRETSHLFFIISEMEIKICTCGTEQHKFDMEGRNFSFKNIQLTCLNLRSIFLSLLCFFHVA